MPLASDPGNLLGDTIGGYGFVDSQLSITLSALNPSLGTSCAFAGGAAAGGRSIRPMRRIY
jgi:hypothetical protein